MQRESSKFSEKRKEIEKTLRERRTDLCAPVDRGLLRPAISGKCTKGVDGGMDEDAGQQAAATIKNRDQQETHCNCKDDLA